MNCTHAATIPDPEWSARRLPLAAESEPVCVSCGMCLLRCPECSATHPNAARMFGSPDFCQVCAGCVACCPDLNRDPVAPLTPADRARAIERATSAVASHWIESVIRAAETPEQAAAVAKRELSKGGGGGRGDHIEGFTNRYNKGRGLDVHIAHRRGVVNWLEIAAYVRRLPLQAFVCLDCGRVIESGFAIHDCDGCRSPHIERDPDQPTARHAEAQSDLFASAAATATPPFEERPPRVQMKLF